MHKLFSYCCSPHVFVIAALCLVVAGPTEAGTLYHWQTDDGGTAYTDHPKRIPERYRASAVKLETKSLESYPRFTPLTNETTESYAKQLNERLGHLRALNAELELQETSLGASAARSQRTTSVRVGSVGERSVEVAGAEGAGPIIVEERRVRAANSFVTRHNTIVRQGDQVLAIVRPLPRAGNSDPSGIPNESDFEK